MNKSEGKSETSKQGKQFAKGSSHKPPAPKRTHSDVSPNRSMEELAVMSHQMEGLSEDLKTIREDLKMVMKKDQMEKFIQDTISKTISDMNENIDLLIEIKTEEKTKKLRDQVEDLKEINSSLKSDIITLKSDLKSLKIKAEETDKRSKTALAKSNYNEQYSRKYNIKILNIKEKDRESEEDLKSDFCRMLQRKEVTMDPSKIVAIHRIPGKPGQPRPLLVRLTNNNDKASVMRKRREFKAAGNRLVDDVTKQNSELISRLLEHREIEQAWYFNGSVYGKSKAGKRHRFDILDDISAVLRSPNS